MVLKLYMVKLLAESLVENERKYVEKMATFCLVYVFPVLFRKRSPIKSRVINIIIEYLLFLFSNIIINLMILNKPSYEKSFYLVTFNYAGILLENYYKSDDVTDRILLHSTLYSVLFLPLAYLTTAEYHALILKKIIEIIIKNII